MGFEQLGMPAGLMRLRLVPETGIEPVRPLFRKAADFKSAVSTYFTTQAVSVLWQIIRG